MPFRFTENIWRGFPRKTCDRSASFWHYRGLTLNTKRTAKLRPYLGDSRQNKDFYSRHSGSLLMMVLQLCALGLKKRQRKDSVSFYQFPENLGEKWNVSEWREGSCPSQFSKLLITHFVKGEYNIVEWSNRSRTGLGNSIKFKVYLFIVLTVVKLQSEAYKLEFKSKLFL